MRAVFAPMLVAVVAAAATPAAAQQARPKFNVGQQVEMQSTDGRWYSGKVQRFDRRNATYLILVDGLRMEETVDESKLRAAGSGEVVPVEFLVAQLGVRQRAGALDQRLQQGGWGQADFEAEVTAKLEEIAAAVAQLEARWPQEDLAPFREYVASRRKHVADNRKGAAAPAAGPGASADEAAALAASYRPIFERLQNFPREVSAEGLLGCVAELEALDQANLDRRIAADAARFPAVFKYYGAEEKGGRYADLPWGGNARPRFEHKALEQLNEYYLPRIYEIKGRLRGKEAELARGVVLAAEAATTVDEANEAMRLARAVAACQPGNPGLAAANQAARAAVDKHLTSIKHLITGDFHRANMRRVVAFSRPQTLGREVADQVTTTIVPGRPLHLVAYLSCSVRSLGAARPDADVGQMVSVCPDFSFRIGGRQAPINRLPVYTTVRGLELDKVGAVHLDLLPDPETVAFATHLQYLPALHFAQWLLTLPVGTHELEVGVTEYDVDERSPAFGRLTLEVGPGTKAALETYLERLWAKKLAAVVFPDTYGAADNRERCVNLGDLAKYGTLRRLSFSQTGQVMKPFPRQNEVNNFVATGWAVFEREGRCEVVELSFSRLPSEERWRWTGLGVTPTHYSLSRPPADPIRPRLLQHGYEILPANVDRTGRW
ncbi:MAG: hypothetical protein KF878_21205 [Planctomycetes bacterium]|nr:hypothetical protein [Planctomycetota bacterium]